MKKRFPLWLEEKEIKSLKKSARENDLSVNAYIKRRLAQAEKTPNLALGDWWDNTDELRDRVKKELKRR